MLELKQRLLRYPSHDSFGFNKPGCITLDIILMFKYQYVRAEGVVINDLFLFVKVFLSFKTSTILDKDIQGLKFIFSSFCISYD